MITSDKVIYWFESIREKRGSNPPPSWWKEQCIFAFEILKIKIDRPDKWVTEIVYKDPLCYLYGSKSKPCSNCPLVSCHRIPVLEDLYCTLSNIQSEADSIYMRSYALRPEVKRSTKQIVIDILNDGDPMFYEIQGTVESVITRLDECIKVLRSTDDILFSPVEKRKGFESLLMALEVI